MDNVIKLPINLYHSIKNLTGGEKFILFYLDEEGKICYNWGSELTLEENAYLLKTIEIFVQDSFRNGIEWK